jgi:thiamine biosynthesis lipoprotein
MGVVVEITIDDDDAGRARAAARAAQEELDRLDAMLSDWKASSELSRFNACGDLRVAASAEMREVLLRALEVARASDGRFDPTVAPLVTLWRTIRRAGGLPPTQALAAERARVRYGLLEVDGEDILRKRPDVALDFGGIGKGYGAVRALAEIRRHGCPRALVAVAGDLAAGDAPRGAQGWTVAIEGERAAGETIVVANQAVSTSGGSVQWVEIEGVRYAHIVDPRTGLGATDLAQVTVVGPLDASVDALGTALALCEQDEDVVRILRAFNDHHARVERAGRAAWHPERPELPNSRRLTSDVPQSPLRGD